MQKIYPEEEYNSLKVLLGDAIQNLQKMTPIVVNPDVKLMLTTISFNHPFCTKDIQLCLQLYYDYNDSNGILKCFNISRGAGSS